MGKKQRHRKKRSAPLIEALEPRVLFSADVFCGALDAPSTDDPLDTILNDAAAAVETARTAEISNRNLENDAKAGPVSDADGVNPVTPGEDNPNSTETPRHELVVVDTATPDYQQLVDGILAQSGEERTFDVLLLDAQLDGLNQLSDILSSYSDLDAVHLISHGEAGEIHIGNGSVDFATLQAQADRVTTWGASLSDEGDLLIYGCDLASTTEGERLVDTLAQLTGADVAASDDLTGSSDKGGDWDLEYKSGKIESSVAFSHQTQEAWDELLTTYTVTSTADDGSPGTLRWAIDQSNATSTVDDIIDFNISGVGPYLISLGSALPTLTDTVTIDGWSEPDYSNEPVVRIDGNTAGGSTSGITVASTADGTIIRGLMITDFTADGIRVESGADFVTIAGNWIGTAGTGTTGVGNGDDGIDLQGSNATIGGTGTNEGNVITNSGDEGIDIVGSGVTNHVIQGNIIGLDPDGATGSGNTDVGIAIISGSGNTIGGVSENARNIISNNYEGIEINTDDNVVQGNYIGTDATGNLDRGNRSDDGVEIQSNASGNLIGGTDPGAGNLIAYNALDGVNIVSGSSNTVLGNEIQSNGDLAIDLGAGANGTQTAPVLATAEAAENQIIVTGSLTSAANDFYRIEFFASTGGGNQTYLGYANVATDGAGNATINATLTASVAVGASISATATNSEASYTTFTDSSKFGANIVAVAANDAPTFGISNNPTYIEDGSAVVLDSNVTIFDAELSVVDNFGGASLTLVRNGGASADDGFSATGTLNALIQGGSLVVDSTTIGTVTTNSSGTLVLTFNSNATNALVNSAMQKIAYSNSNDAPPANVQIDWSFDDGNSGAQGSGGALEGMGSITVDIIATNDAPVANADAYSVDEDSTLTVDWWDSDWSHRKQLTFDNLAQSETLTDFPVLIVLNSGNIDYALTKDEGSDLRFFAADGTPLAYEIEQWNEGGDSSVWVRVPQITGSSASDSITMYYGNAAADPVNAVTGVWDSDFVGVWHLNEEQAGTGNNGIYEDSTSNGNDGIDRIAAIGQEGQVTDGQEFGANDWVEIEHDPSLDLKDSMTISFWIKPTSNSETFNRVVEKGLWGYGDSYYFGGGDGTNDLTFYLNGQAVFDTEDNVLAVGEWQHVTVSYTSNGDGTGSARLYIDGVEVDNNGDPAGAAALPIGTYNGGAVSGNTGRLAIGHENSSYDFDGFIDEVQISKTDRSADWIAAQYQATKNQFGSEFVQFGGVETAPVVDGVVTNDTDIDCDLLSASVVTGPSHAASFTFNKDGTFNYTPSADFNGIDTFTYKLNDGTGDSNTQTVTISVNPINDAPVARPDGVQLSFDGDDFIEVADHASLQMTNKVSMEAWINPTGAGTGSQIILNKEGEYELGITADTGEIKFAIAKPDNTWAWHNTGYFVTASEWTHIAVTYDGVAGEAKTYINGEMVDTFAQSGVIGDVYTGLNDLWIGGRENDPADRFEGQIDEVRVWNTARTFGEIQANMNGQLAGAEVGLVGNWRLDEAAGGAVVDQSAFGNDGILGGSEGAAATPSYQGYVTDQNTVLNIAAGAGVLANDIDIDGVGMTVTNLDTTGMLGNLVLNTADGSFSYNPNGAFDYLDVGDQATETFTYTAYDGSTDSNVVTVTITVTGVEDSSVISGDVSYAGNEGDAVAGDMDATDIEGLTDGTYFSVTTPATNGTAAIDPATGAWTFTPTDPNWFGSDAFTVTVTDDLGGTTTQVVSITLSSVNDMPIIGGNSTGAVTEDIDPDLDALLETTGSLTITDPDLGESSFSAGTIVGTYGNLSIDVSGNWSYAADNTQAAIQQLDVGESVNDVLTVTTADGTTRDITITINGGEDAPVITATSTGTVAEDDALTTNGTFSISDVDSNDNPISFPDEGGTLGDNGFGNFVLSGSTWTYTLNTAHASVQALDAGQSLTDSHTFIASDGSSQLVTVTINGAEEAPLIGDWGIDTETEGGSDEVSDQVLKEADAIDVLEEETHENRPIYSVQERAAEDLAWAEEPDVLGSEPVSLPPLDDAALVSVLTEVRRDSDPNGNKIVAHTPIPPKFIDLNHLDIAPFVLENPDLSDLKSIRDNDSFVNSLEDLDYSLDEAIKEEENRSRIEVESAIGIVMSLSAGFVSWVLRAGSLLASFMSVFPLWRQFDPLPILDVKGKKHRATNEDQKDAEKVEENTAVENIFDDEKSD